MKSKALRFARSMRGAAVLAVAVYASLAATGEGRAQSVFRGVQIDMSGIPSGAAETRRDLQACLASRLPQALAGRINPGARNAPVLTVRPTSVWLASVLTNLTSEDDRGGSGSSGMDQLEGEAIVSGQRIPLLVSANPDFGTLGAATHNARVRTDALCSSFAHWIARKI
jgi:hypothetical protein